MKKAFYMLDIMCSINPQLAEFIRFCVERRGIEWPAIYHEMAWVSVERLFRGMDYDELRCYGLSLAASNLDRLQQQVKQVADSCRES